MRPTTATLAGEFTAALLLHYGPGPHPDGSPQSVHAGGMPHQAPPAKGAGQMAFDFASPAPAKAPERPKPAGPDTTAMTDRLIARYAEAKPEDDGQFATGRHNGWLAPDGRLIDITGDLRMHSEIAYEALNDRPASSDIGLLAAQRELQRIGFVRFAKGAKGPAFSALGAIAPAARQRIEHIFDRTKPFEWSFDLEPSGPMQVGWHVLSYEDNAAEKLRAKTGIDIRGLYETALARRRKQLCLS